MNIRTFRLLSDTEIKRLMPRAQALKQVLSAHGAIDHIELKQAKSTARTDECMLVTSQNHQLAAIDKHDLNRFQRWLLRQDEAHEVYYQVSKQVLTHALNAFFNTNDLSLQTTENLKDWFYQGSPCLEIHFKLKAEDCSIFVNPEWISDQALPLQNKNSPLANLSECLGEERIELSVQFSGFELSLKDLAGLSEGDVIELDHALASPLTLTLKNKTLSPVTLGKKEQHKAIKLRGNHV